MTRAQGCGQMAGRVGVVALGVMVVVGAVLPGTAVSSAAEPTGCFAGEVPLRDPLGGREALCAKCPDGMVTVVRAERDGLTCVARRGDRTEPGAGL